MCKYCWRISTVCSVQYAFQSSDVIILNCRLKSPQRTPLLLWLPALTPPRVVQRPKNRPKLLRPAPLQPLQPPQPSQRTSLWRALRMHPQRFPAEKKGTPSSCSSRTWYQTNDSTFTYSFYRYNKTFLSLFSWSNLSAFYLKCGEGCFLYSSYISFTPFYLTCFESNQLCLCKEHAYIWISDMNSFAHPLTLLLSLFSYAQGQKRPSDAGVPTEAAAPSTVEKGK